MNPKFELASAIDPESVLTYVPRWPLVVHLISAVFCLGSSATYHLLCCYSCEVNASLARLDYAGICFLIMGSSYSGCYYGFACEGVSWLRTLWMVYMTVTCAGTMVLFLVPMFASSGYRAFRGWLFVIVGFSTGMWMGWLAFSS
jgi:adiponectin receptor